MRIPVYGPSQFKLIEDFKTLKPFIKNKGIYKDYEKKEIKNAEQPSDAKIYYIKDGVPKKKPRKTVSRKPDLAFKGIVIRPEEFSEKKYYVNGK